MDKLLSELFYPEWKIVFAIILVALWAPIVWAYWQFIKAVFTPDEDEQEV